jgi:hypothetical protein
VWLVQKVPKFESPPLREVEGIWVLEYCGAHSGDHYRGNLRVGGITSSGIVRAVARNVATDSERKIGARLGSLWLIG